MTNKTKNTTTSTVVKSNTNNNEVTVAYFRLQKISNPKYTIMEISHEEWESQIIADVCNNDYWEYIDREIVETNIEAISEAIEDFNEKEYRECTKLDGLYFDSEFYCNPAEVNYINVTDIVESGFYNNISDLKRDNKYNADIMKAVEKYEDETKY